MIWCGRQMSTIRRDYREIVPLLRHRYEPDHPVAVALRGRPRDVRLTIDAALQLRVASIVEAHAKATSGKAAAVVLDPDTGGVLASVSYPWPSADGARLRADGASASQARLRAEGASAGQAGEESDRDVESRLRADGSVAGQALLRAEARVVNRGKNVGYMECDVTDQDGKHIARATSTCFVLRGDQAR